MAIYFESDKHGEQLRADIDKSNGTVRENLQEQFDELDRIQKDSDLREEKLLKESGLLTNPIFSAWWNRYCQLYGFERGMFKLALNTFLQYFQFEELKDELSEFVKSMQNGFVAGWEDFSKHYLSSSDFLGKHNSQLDKSSFLQFQNKTYKYLQRLYIGNKNEKEHSEMIKYIMDSEHYKFIEDVYLKHQNNSNKEEKGIEDNKSLPAFRSFILTDKDKIDKILKLLSQLLKNKKGKEVAHIIIALIEESLIVSPDPRKDFYDSMRKEFGIICSDASINDFLNPNNKHKIDKNKVNSITLKLRDLK